MEYHSIRTKLLLIISLLLIAGFAALLFLNDRNNTEDFVKITEGMISNRSEKYISSINSHIKTMIENGYATAEAGELFYRKYRNSPPSVLRREVEEYLLRRIKRNPTIYGSGIWYSPTLFDSGSRIGPYAFWNGDDVRITNEFTDHDFTEDDWYRTAIPENWDLSRKRAFEQYVTKPYDYGDGHIYITLNTIMNDENGNIIGVSSTDWTLDFLPRLLEDFTITDNTRVFLGDPETGQILYSSENSLDSDREVMATLDSEHEQGQATAISRDMLIGSQKHTVYRGITDLGYLLVFSVPDREAYSSLISLRLSNSRNFIVILIVFILIIYLFSESLIFRPLNRLRDATRDFGRSNFKRRAEVLNPRDEIGLLALDFNYMAEQLEKSFRDMTELNRSLEEKVRDRTAHLEQVIDTLESTQEKLVIYERIAATANIIAGIAHQINTPLGVAITATSYLEDKLEEMKEEKADKTFREAAAMISKNLRKAAELISAFKKLSLNQFVEEKRHFNLKDLLTNTLNAVKGELEENRVSLSLECDAGLNLYTYAGVISQIILILIENTIKHGFPDREDRSITIECRNQIEDLLITFSDNGIGIDENIRDRIFDPFYTTGNDPGLGLSVVHNLVTLKLHGKIYSASPAGQGATFIISIPMDIIT